MLYFILINEYLNVFHKNEDVIEVNLNAKIAAKAMHY